MTKLLPCPFCGGMTKVVQCDDEGNVRGEEYESNPWSGLGYRVVHESDDCPISTGEDGYNLIYDSREEAVEAWNNRAERTCHAVFGKCFHPQDEDRCLDKDNEFFGFDYWQDCEFYGCRRLKTVCSECGAVFKGGYLTKNNYCQNCGARVIDDANV